MCYNIFMNKIESTPIEHPQSVRLGYPVTKECTDLVLAAPDGTEEKMHVPSQNPIIVGVGRIALHARVAITNFLT